MSIVYGYCRCSTNELKQDIQRQVRELLQLGATRDTIFMEYESGAKVNRVELQKLLNIISAGDTLMATEISRITRSTKQLCEIIELVQQRRIKLVVGSFVIDCTNGVLDPMTEGMLKMMGVFSELERKMIVERVKSGMRNARAKGHEIGRPPLKPDEIPPAFEKYYSKYTSGEISITELSRLCQMSRTTIYKYLHLTESRTPSVQR